MTLEPIHGTTWVLAVRRQREPAARLFCFPYAVGSASVFRHWHTSLPDSIELCAVQLPGRSDRRAERPFARMESLVEVTAFELAPLLDRPFALFGHSMGALVAFELARLLSARSQPPALLMPAGRGAPELPDPGPALHAATEQALVDELLRLGGASREMFADRERLSRIIPLVRADFAVCETYAFRESPPLACPIAAFGGQRDPDWPEEHMQAWQRHTSNGFRLTMLPGEHFFLHTCERELLAAMRAELERVLLA